MGTCKQLLPLGERTAVDRCLEALASAGIGVIVAVVSPGSDEVAEEVRRHPVILAVNEVAACDMADSVRTGLRHIPAATTAVIVALADHPLVAPDTYRILAARHAIEPDAIIIPVHDGKKGHPTLFPRPLLEELAGLPTMRDVIRHHHDKIRLLPVADEGVVLEMDVWEDYERLIERNGA
jgi:CTP:molybdopterin cytidylyltransferase MocA